MSATRSILIAILTVFWTLGQPTLAEDQMRVTGQTPVAIVSSTQGPSLQITRKGSDQKKPLYWLDVLYSGDVVHGGESSNLTITYFHDRSKWALQGPAEAEVRRQKLSSDGLFTDHIREQESSKGVISQPFQVASLLTEPVPTSSLGQADPDNLATEKVQLSAYADVGIYPPVFRWAPNSMSNYQLSIYDEKGQFLHSFDVKEQSFDYPHHSQAPLRLTKGATYFWQVEDVDENDIVNKYPFSPLTRLQIKELNRYQHLLAEDDKATYVDLYLAQLQHGALDKYLHLLERMNKIDSNNPRLKTLLAGAYLKRGAPNHAQQQLDAASAILSRN